MVRKPKINKNEELTLYSKDKQCLVNRLWMEMFMKIQTLDAPFRGTVGGSSLLSTRSVRNMSRRRSVREECATSLEARLLGKCIRRLVSMWDPSWNERIFVSEQHLASVCLVNTPTLGHWVRIVRLAAYCTARKGPRVYRALFTDARSCDCTDTPAGRRQRPARSDAYSTTHTRWGTAENTEIN